MDDTPTKEFLAACRLVLGADDPATVIGALQSADSDLIERLDFTHRSIVELAQISSADLVHGRRAPRMADNPFLPATAGRKAPAVLNSIPKNRSK